MELSVGARSPSQVEATLWSRLRFESSRAHFVKICVDNLSWLLQAPGRVQKMSIQPERCARHRDGERADSIFREMPTFSLGSWSYTELLKNSNSVDQEKET